jgi:acyl carrier protein
MEHEVVVERVLRLFGDELSIDVDSPTTDLIETGLLDSLALVELIAAIEQEFQVDLALDALEIDAFRSAETIAAFVETLGARSTSSGA